MNERLNVQSTSAEKTGKIVSSQIKCNRKCEGERSERTLTKDLTDLQSPN